jgi:hypothetical protein
MNMGSKEGNKPSDDKSPSRRENKRDQMAANKIAQANKKTIPTGKRQERSSFKNCSGVYSYLSKGKSRHPSTIHHPINNQQYVMKSMAVIGQGGLNERKTGAEGVRERCEIEYSYKHDATIKSKDKRHSKRQNTPTIALQRIIK